MAYSNEHTRIDELIYLYISGTIDKSSLKELEDWAMQSEENRRYVCEKLEVWFSSGMLKESASFDWRCSYEKLQPRLFAEFGNVVPHRVSLKNIATWAVAIVLALVLPLCGYLYGAGLNASSGFKTPVCMETLPGSRSKVDLPDGTKVWLNADTRLTYTGEYGIRERRVKVDGEALFDVVEDARHPFIIHSEEFDLKVLGTRFTYSNYKNDKNVKVDLIRGKVFLASNRGGKIYLNPNERMVLDRATGRMITKKIDASYSSEWAYGRLFFDEQPLSEIAKTLERNYNVTIHVNGAMKNESFYGLFDMQKNTVEDILKAISSTRQMKYKYNRIENEYILY